MQSIDGATYRKYFSQRRVNSKWSEKNKALVEKLEGQGSMTDHGRAKIEEAKRNGQWDAPKPQQATEDQIEQVARALEGHEPAHANFLAMSPSVKKTYTRAYFDAKTDAGRNRRLAWMIERLDKNLKPMQSCARQNEKAGPEQLRYPPRYANRTTSATPLQI